MKPLNIGFTPLSSPLRDVAKPQTAILNNSQCLLYFGQAMVPEDRTQAVYTSHLGGAAGQSAASVPQKTRSRGCRRAQQQFWHSALLLSWQLAALKPNLRLFISKTRFPKSRSIPVSTSNIWGRAAGAFRAVPALFLSAPDLKGGAV